MILVQEQTLDIWRGSGAESQNDLRFDFTNATATMGLFSMPQKLAKEAQNDDKLIIQKNGHRIHISPSEMLLKFSSANSILLNEAGITITTPRLNVIADKITETSAGRISQTAGTATVDGRGVARLGDAVTYLGGSATITTASGDVTADG